MVICDRQRNRQIRGRLIATRLPAEQAEKARARLRRELKGKVTDLDREAAAYVVLFTTAPKSKLDATRCLALYRIRWQVELLFKRWKSLCGFDRLPNYLDETILAWLYAKVLLALLMQRMASWALSPPEDPEESSARRPRPSNAPTLEARFAALARYHRRSASTRAA